MYQLRVVSFLFIVLLPAALAAAQIQADFLVADTARWPTVAIDPYGRMHVGLTKIFPSLRFSYVFLYDSVGQLVRIPQNFGDSQAWQVRSVPGPQMAVIVWAEDNRGFYNSYILGCLANLDLDSLSPSIMFWSRPMYQWRPAASWLCDTVFIVAWEGGDEFNAFQVYGQLGTISTPQAGTSLLVSDDTSATRPNFAAGVATHESADRFAVVWLQGESKGNSVRLRVFSKAGSALGPSVEVAQADTSAYLGSPKVKMYPNGDILVAWPGGKDGGDWGVFVRRYTKDATPISDPAAVNVTPAGQGADLDIALRADGKGIVVWESAELFASKLRAQRLNADGSLLDDNFLIAAKQDSVNQWFPSVSICDSCVYVGWEQWEHREYPEIRARIFHFNDNPVDVRNEGAPLNGLALSLECYPNPFNASTQIRFFVGSETNVAISVYNVLGQEIARPSVGRPQAGTHTVEWSGASCASGVYFCRIRAGSLFRTVKLLLVR